MLGGLVFDFWIMSKVGEGFCKANKWSFRIRCEGGGVEILDFGG